KLRQGTLNGGATYISRDCSNEFGITALTLTVTANAGQSKVYGEVDPVFGYTVSGLQNNDDETVLHGALSRDAGQDVGSYKLRQEIGRASCRERVSIDGDAVAIRAGKRTV